MKLTVEDYPFLEGDFRAVYKAKCVDNGKLYAVKRFLQSTLAEMENLNSNLQTPETAKH